MADSARLTEEEIDIIAEKAAARAVAKMTGALYQEVGKTVVKKFFWIVGVLAVGIVAGYQYAQQLFK